MLNKKQFSKSYYGTRTVESKASKHSTMVHNSLGREGNGRDSMDFNAGAKTSGRIDRKF